MQEQSVKCFYWPEKGKGLARTCLMNVRNATCVGTQTSKVSTQNFVFLFRDFGQQCFHFAELNFSSNFEEGNLRFFQHCRVGIKYRVLVIF